MRRILALLALLIAAVPAQAQWATGTLAPGLPLSGGTVTGAITLPGTVTPALDFGVGGSTNVPTQYFETLENFAPYAFVKGGANFTQSGQTFFDDILYWGFNKTTGGGRINNNAAAIGWSLETDYWNNGVHALELNFDAAGPAFTQATIGGTITNGDVLTLTVTGGFVGSPHSVAATASGASTTTTLASALAAAVVADATFQTAGFTAYSSGAVVKLYATKAGAPQTSVWSQSVSGSATETITLAAGTPWTVRPYAFGMDRDSGPDSPGYMNHTFRVGNGSGVGFLSVVDSTNTINLLSVDGHNQGYVTIGASGISSNLIMASAANSSIQTPNSTTLAFSMSSGGFYLRGDTGEFDFGTGADTRIARTRAGTLRFGSNGANIPVHTSYYAGSGPAPTIGTGASNFGTSPSIDSASTDSTGRITVGTSPGASGTLTFVSAWQKAPVVLAVNETTSQMVRTTPTTTGVTFTGTFAANDKISYICLGVGAE